MLKIENLHATIEGKAILKGLNLEIGAGEIHAIMGPNGSGKSTLAAVLTGRDEYEVTEGSVQFMGKDLLDLEPDERAQLGLFLGFQYPVEIPGVSNMYFMKAAVNALRKGQGLKELDAMDFLKKVKEKVALMEMRDEFLHRAVNQGFSGGEKKRNEILQMAMFEPKLAILDEIDSGLDIDALKVVAKGVNAQISEDRSVLLVTHYQRLLDYIVPDFIHVMSEGQIIKSGDKSLALELEEKGYSWINQDAA
ncbi:MAG: Fe-S cluster assembly ATPase SufC [Arenicellales bacterium]